MGVDATSAASALFSPCRSRKLQRGKNRSWRTKSAARRVGSVAALGLTAHTGNFRTSKRSAALGESSQICSRRRFFIQTERRPSAANRFGRDVISKDEGLLLPSLSGLHRVRKTNVGEATARREHFGSIGVAFSPADLPVQGGKKRRSRTNQEESTLLRRRRSHFREHKPGRTKNLHDALSWQRRHG